MGGRPFCEALDPGPEFQELALDVLIAPVNVVRTVDRGRALGRQRGEDQRGTGAQVADLDVGAVQRRSTGDDGVVGVDDVDLGAHPAQLGHPLEPVLEDRLVDVRGAPRAWVSSTEVGGWRSVASPG